MRQPKVLIYTTAKSGTGVPRFNEDIADALQTDGWRVVIAQPPEDGYADRMGKIADLERLSFALDPYDDVVGFSADRFLAADIFRDVRPDLVVFSNGIHPLAAYAAMEAAQFFMTPYVIVDGLISRSLFSWGDETRSLAAQAYRRSAAVIVKSRQNLDILRECLGLGEDVGRVIESGRPEIYFQPIDPRCRASWRRRLRIPNEAILCLTVAKLEQVKGHDVQVDAMKLLRQRPVWDRLYFAWVGEGEERNALATLLAEGGLADRVRMLGHRTDVADLLDSADCFLLPSRSEGIPLSLMEAMAKGLPVIATAVGGVPEALGDAGILISPIVSREAVVNGVVAGLERLVVDDKARQSLGAAARDRAGKRFRLQRMIEAYRAVFKTALKEKHGDIPT